MGVLEFRNVAFETRINVATNKKGKGGTELIPINNGEGIAWFDPKEKTFYEPTMAVIPKKDLLEGAVEKAEEQIAERLGDTK